MDWEKEYTQALQYAKAAKGLVGADKVNNETIYHIICLSVEKCVAAMAAKVNYIPMHSALNLVFREISKKVEIPDTFYSEVRFVNSFMTYCSLEIRQPKPISNGDITRMIKFLNDLFDLHRNVKVA